MQINEAQTTELVSLSSLASCGYHKNHEKAEHVCFKYRGHIYATVTQLNGCLSLSSTPCRMFVVFNLKTQSLSTLEPPVMVERVECSINVTHPEK